MYHCILDKNVHRTLKFNVELSKDPNIKIQLLLTPTAADPNACTLQIKINGRILALSCPGIMLLSKRICQIDVEKPGQFTMDFMIENDYRVLLVGNELVDDANVSVTIRNKRMIGTLTPTNNADFFTITENGQPTQEVAAGDGIKIPPGVG